MTPERAEPQLAGGRPAWLERNATAVVLGLVGIGLALRVATALPTFLNPDEALNFLSANRRTLGEAIRYGMFNPHPPLYYIFLWFWRFIGRSDFMLRLPSVLAGTAAIWVGWRWLSEAFDRRAGLVGAALLALSPEMVALSAEVRSYIFEVLLVLVVLHQLERGLRGSVRAMLVAGFVLALAVLTHYSALLVALTLGLYTLIELLRRRAPGRVTLAWLAGQAVAAGTGLWLYLVHIRLLRGGAMEEMARTGWLSSSYFHSGTDSLLWFPLRQTWAAFRYMFASPVAGTVGLALSVGALVLLLVRRGAGRRDRLVLLALPFVTVCAAAVAGVHPYGGSRHSFFLVTFAVAAISWVVAELAGRRLAWVLVALVVLAVPWHLTARPGGQQYIPPRHQARSLMTEAVSYIRQLAPDCRFVFSDQQTQILLQRYLCGHRGDARWTGDYVEYESGDLLLVRPGDVWLMTAGRLAERFPKLERDYRLDTGDEVCVVFAGWGEDLLNDFRKRFHNNPPAALRFGERIAVFVLPAVGDALDTLAVYAARELPAPPVSIVWPSAYFGESSRLLAERLTRRALSGSQLSAQLAAGRALEDFLPALFLWQFRPRERYDQLLLLMDGGHSYVAGGYRFALLGSDPLGVVAAYVVSVDSGR